MTHTLKSWLITGASGGFGRALTEQLLARGDRVTATLRRTGALDDLAAHGRLRVLHLDLLDAASIRGAVGAAFGAGRIDVVVGNAGYGLFGAAEELGDAAIDRQVATNLTGAMHLIRASLPHLRTQGGGRFVQISSEGGQTAYPGFSAYHATKWGIEGFVEAVAQEVAPFGIEMMLVEPGPTATNFGAGLDRAVPMPVYEGTAAGAVRRAIAEGSFALSADLGRSVAAIVAAADAPAMPRRLALGSTAWGNIRGALTSRLAELEGQRAVAFAADVLGTLPG